MQKPERIEFNFTGEGGVADVAALEDILSSGHWSSRSLNFEDERTGLMLHLLQIGGIQIYRRRFEPIEKFSDTERQQASELMRLTGKRSMSSSLLELAHFFGNREYDTSRTLFNSLYYLELQAYIRIGGITLDRLFEMLEKDDCKAVVLFTDVLPADGVECFYIISRAMPKDEFLKELEALQERTLAAMHEALMKTAENNIIPSL